MLVEEVFSHSFAAYCDSAGELDFDIRWKKAALGLALSLQCPVKLDKAGPASLSVLFLASEVISSYTGEPVQEIARGAVIDATRPTALDVTFVRTYLSNLPSNPSKVEDWKELSFFAAIPFSWYISKLG